MNAACIDRERLDLEALTKNQNHSGSFVHGYHALPMTWQNKLLIKDRQNILVDP